MKVMRKGEELRISSRLWLESVSLERTTSGERQAGESVGHWGVTCFVFVKFEELLGHPCGDGS